MPPVAFETIHCHGYVEYRKECLTWQVNWVGIQRRFGVGVCLFALLALVTFADKTPRQISCCSSWNVVASHEQAVVRGKVQEHGVVREHVGELGEQYQIVPFTLVVTEVIKQSVRREKAGDQLQLWVRRDTPQLVRGTEDQVRWLIGQDAVFLLATTTGTGSYPEGYILYAAESFWVITGDRVTGGTGAFKLQDAPYSELVQKVNSAVQGQKP